MADKEEIKTTGGIRGKRKSTAGVQRKIPADVPRE